MKRIDRIISEQTKYSRKEIKELISKGKVVANEKKVSRPEEKYDDNVIIIIDDKKIDIKNHIYLLLNKPKGYVSATRDNKDKTVLDLVPDEFKSRDLFPAGRLDKDTTGLMLITDDGEFSHNILSPSKHVKKSYEVKIDLKITDDMIECFRKGVKLKDGICKEAILEKTSEFAGIVTIKEGRYHQIKRMFGCFGATVIELNRIAIGNLKIPSDLKVGMVREAKKEELDKIQEKA
jgi:16S rRNA pseudouridine516 synthase